MVLAILKDKTDLGDFLFEYAEQDGERITAKLCLECQARGFRSEELKPGHWVLCDCEGCNATGAIGVDPTLPCIAPPGSMEKVLVLAARYRAGLPVWNPHDEKTQRPGNWRVIKESKHQCRFVPLSSPPAVEDWQDDLDFDDLCE